MCYFGILGKNQALFWLYF